MCGDSDEQCNAAYLQACREAMVPEVGARIRCVDAGGPCVELHRTPSGTLSENSGVATIGYIPNMLLQIPGPHMRSSGIAVLVLFRMWAYANLTLEFTRPSVESLAV